MGIRTRLSEIFFHPQTPESTKDQPEGNISEIDIAKDGLGSVPRMPAKNGDTWESPSPTRLAEQARTLAKRLPNRDN